LVLKYYSLLGSVSTVYWKLCEPDSDKGSSTWREQSNRLSIISTEIDEFSRLLLNHNQLCSSRLFHELENVRRLCWMPNETSDDLSDFIEQENEDEDGYDEKSWYFEPLFWADQIGLCINELFLNFTNMSVNELPSNYASQLEELGIRFRVCSNRGTLATKPWKKRITEIGLASDATEQVYTSLRELFMLSKDFARYLYNEKETPDEVLSALFKFTSKRNAKSLELAELMAQLE
jgi:hypothetical protein